MGNYKTAASASASWSLVRKKLLAANGSTAPSSQEAKGSPKKTKAKTQAGETANDDDDDDEKDGAEFTPVNTPKKNKGGVKRESSASPKLEAEIAGDGAKKEEANEHIKTESNERSILASTPTKKRGRKPKDGIDPSPKRSKVRVIDASPLNSGDHGGGGVFRTVPVVPSRAIEDDDDLDGLGLLTDLEQEILQRAADGSFQLDDA